MLGMGSSFPSDERILPRYRRWGIAAACFVRRGRGRIRNHVVAAFRGTVAEVVETFGSIVARLSNPMACCVGLVVLKVNRASEDSPALPGRFVRPPLP